MNSFYTVFLGVVIPLAFSSPTSTTPALTTTTPIPTFECGNDLCSVNIDYCDKQGSSNPIQWACSPCSDIPDKWCMSDITKVDRDCFGYCKDVEYKVIKYKLEQDTNSKGTKSTDDSPNCVHPSSTFDAFLFRRRHLLGTLALLSPLGLVGALVIGCVWYRKYRGNRHYRQIDVIDMPVKENIPNEAHIEQETGIVTHSNSTQTDLSMMSEVKGDLDVLDPKYQKVVMTQPADKGSHGVRVLKQGTVNVDSNGRDSVDDNAFLNVV